MTVYIPIFNIPIESGHFDCSYFSLLYIAISNSLQMPRFLVFPSVWAYLRLLKPVPSTKELYFVFQISVFENALLLNTYSYSWDTEAIKHYQL